MTVRAEVKPGTRGWVVSVFEPQDEAFWTCKPNRPWVYWRPSERWAVRLGKRLVYKREKQRARLLTPAHHIRATT
jgi:hypothetical protein